MEEKKQIDSKVIVDTIEFLERTKEGTYAPIDEYTIEIGRIEVETIQTEEVFYYSITS